MTHPDHLADEVFSELVDGQLSPDETSLAQAHLGTCSACQARMEQLQVLVGLLRSLPSVEPPRDFRIGPRVVADPPNVVRMRRWYAWTRAGAGALAAAFVFLSAGTLYVDSRPVAPTATLASKAQPAPAAAPAAQSAPAPAAQTAPETIAQDAGQTVAPSAPTPAARAAAPAAAPAGQAPAAQPAAPALAPAPPAAAGASVRSQAAPSPTSTETGDQIAAATTVRPLPTQVPTPALLAQPTAAVASLPVTQQPRTDPAAPLRVAAALVGVLAAFGILLALLIRHRLRAVSPSHLE